MGKNSLLSPLDCKDLPSEVRETIIRLMCVAAGNGMDLPSEMLEEIAAISIDGADPQWQIEQMQRILDRWAPIH